MPPLSYYTIVLGIVACCLRLTLQPTVVDRLYHSSHQLHFISKNIFRKQQTFIQGKTEKEVATGNNPSIKK